MGGATPTGIVVGVDTHRHTHAAVAVTGLGARLGELTIEVGLDGHRELEARARSLGAIRAFGIEGTGSCGAGLARFLRGAGAATSSMRSAAPTAGCAAGTAGPIPSTPRPPPAPCPAARPAPCPRPEPAKRRWSATSRWPAMPP